MNEEKVKFKGLNVYEIIALCLLLIVGLALMQFDLKDSIVFSIVGIFFDYLCIKCLILFITFLIKKLRLHIKKKKELKKVGDDNENK